MVITLMSVTFAPEPEVLVRGTKSTEAGSRVLTRFQANAKKYS